MQQQPTKQYLKDYSPANFLIESTKLRFDLHEDYCLVSATLKMKRTSGKAALILDGVELELLEASVDGRSLSSAEYKITSTSLEITTVPDQFELKTKVKIYPQKNTSLEGLYRTGKMFCTQCEAQGFRKITYYLDRPDVMTSFEVSIEADSKAYPILLSNGDRTQAKSLADGRHEVTWKDPFKKPSYLFALVAGNLGMIKDHFTTVSGKKVQLEIYAEFGQQERCRHAMESLKKSMAWDEERFGREYDLSTYMVVAADDFNAGAMENKGLNIFNTRLVLADSKSATDDEYFRIESVVAHEYFHNWTGNRVTLRDWFHLSLKEGLTVFRDQEFSMDQSSRSLVRIDNVMELRNRQFVEDSGPNAHPIRPESCYAVDNFFTATIYEKGAEVIRMMQTMVGRPGFRKGMDLYFSRHDGQAVIIEDFARAIADANQQQWDQFKLWYSQAGTPEVRVKENYNAAQKTYELELSQYCPPTPEQKDKKPFHIPLMVGLLGPDGKDLPLHCTDIAVNTEKQSLLHLKQAQQKFIFTQVAVKPVLSLNRGFSAPIRLQWQPQAEDLFFLFENDSDEFNQWEAGQSIATRLLADLIDGKQSPAAQRFSTVLAKLTGHDSLSESFRAKLLTLPNPHYLAQLQSLIDAGTFLDSYENLEAQISQQGKDVFFKIYKNLHGKNTESKDPKDFGRRHLKNLCLSYLALFPEGQELAWKQFSEAQIMTDQESALEILLNSDSKHGEQALEMFMKQWKNDNLVINKWFAVQASRRNLDTFTQVTRLFDHPIFNIKNPNRVYALLRTFGQNIFAFHSPKHETYRFYADRIIEIDKMNPQVATRLASAFDSWTKLPGEQKTKAHRELERMLKSPLSKNTFEIVNKSAQA